MHILVIGASKGLGKAFVEGLPNDGDTIIGVSRQKPAFLALNSTADVQWIEADLADPLQAATHIDQHTPHDIDVIICNVGIWEDKAFEDDYSFLTDTDDKIMHMVDVNITATILVLKRLMPKLLRASKSHIILTGSTSALPQNGRPEVTFNASKYALKGMADSLREGFRDQGLAVTCLQLGYLNTTDDLATPVKQAALRGNGTLIPVHDVVAITRTLMHLSGASFVKELILPAIVDERF